MHEKGQAALEFLMTYGWAIMTVLIAIGALSYFGVLSPDRFIPSKCVLPAGIACIDHEVTDVFGLGLGEVHLTLRNSLGYNIKTVSVSVSDCTSGSSETLIENNGKKNFIAGGCTVSSGEKYSGEINVTYTHADTNLPHKVTGTLNARIRSGLV